MLFGHSGSSTVTKPGMVADYYSHFSGKRQARELTGQGLTLVRDGTGNSTKCGLVQRLYWNHCGRFLVNEFVAMHRAPQVHMPPSYEAEKVSSSFGSRQLMPQYPSLT